MGDDPRVTPQKRGSEQVQVSMLSLNRAFNQKPRLRQKLLKANLYLIFLNSLISDIAQKDFLYAARNAPHGHANIQDIFRRTE